MVILSVQVFVLTSKSIFLFFHSYANYGTVVFLGILNIQLMTCEYTLSGGFIGVLGCYNLNPAKGWIDRSIIGIFLVFMIAFLPLFLQGKVRSHLPSLSKAIPDPETDSRRAQNSWIVGRVSLYSV